MFQLNEDEANFLVPQNVIPSKQSLGGTLPSVLTQEGIAMLSGVLRSPRAIYVNIAIMRPFIKMREMILTNAKFARKLAELEARLDKHDENALVIMATLRKLISKPDESKKNKIGFHK